MFLENVVDDLLGHGLLGSKKQIIDDSVRAVLHRQRFRYKLEASHLTQPLLKCSDDGVVSLFYDGVPKKSPCDCST
jgi:hypothetical protein